MDLEKMLSKNDKVELERLYKKGDFLNGLADVSDAGAVLAEISLFGVMMYMLYFENIPFMNKLIISAFAFYFPWSVWVIKCMDIPINFNISNIILISSGIVVGARLICLVMDRLIDNANAEIREILEKYDEEGMKNEDD